MRQLYRFKNLVTTLLLAGSVVSANAQTVTFNYTGAVQTYTVGSGVSSLVVDAQGAKGGTGGNGTINDRGGYGGRAQCSLAVTPGQVLYLLVGGQGGNGSGTCCGTVIPGGYNGGGAANYGNGGSGGGASDIRIGGTTLANRVVVAGGGGGGGFSSTSIYFDNYERGGEGGALSAESGHYDDFVIAGYGGGGGTATAGGAGGTVMCTSSSGASGVGGASSSTCYGGGGGGGYYGGGGGSNAGGGGGSSYTSPTLATAVVHTAGYRTGSNGVIVLTPVCPSFSGGAISGRLYGCVGESDSLTNPTGTSGGVWTSSAPAVATINMYTGVVTCVSPGLTSITYTVTSGCGTATAVASFTVFATPSVTASATYATCGDDYTLSATGASSYTWSPSTGLSCPTCSTTTVNPTATTTFTVLGVSGYCSSSATVTVNGNRILGHVSFSSTPPDTLDMKVWLIQFNPIDSSITALDSTLTCLDAGAPYFEFASRAAGNYMVKGKMLYGSYAGMSGYVPTYSLASPHWSTGATVSHAAATDSMHITMQYGTVPAGPGFISGYVVSGAGRGTTGDVPAPGMLIYLLDATTHRPVTYAYTNTAGAYTFTGIGYGTYIIHPEEYDYNTIESAVITLSSTTPSATAVDFRQFTTSRVIKPFVIVTTGVASAPFTGISLYPNPTTGVLNINWSNQTVGEATMVITDMIGRTVYTAPVSINATSGQATVSLSDLKAGLYMISIKSDNINYSGKLQIAK